MVEPDTKQRVAEYTRRGIVPRSIAQILDVSPQAVYQHLTKLGMQPAQGAPLSFEDIATIRLEVAS